MSAKSPNPTKESLHAVGCGDIISKIAHASVGLVSIKAPTPSVLRSKKETDIILIADGTLALILTQIIRKFAVVLRASRLDSIQWPTFASTSDGEEKISGIAEEAGAFYLQARRRAS